MLLQLAQYEDARELTASLPRTLEATAAHTLLADSGVAHDPDRAARVLAGWMEITAAAMGRYPLLLAGLDFDPGGTAAVQELLDSTAAPDGAPDLEAAARCMAALPPQDRVALLANEAQLVTRYVSLAGGLDELLEQDSAHRRLAGQTQAWVSGAAWTICVMTERESLDLALDRIGHLAETEGRAAELWQLWAQLGASMISSRAISIMMPSPDDLDDYITGLPQQAVAAVHTGIPKQVRRVQRRFAEQPPKQQAALLVEMAALIGANRSLPSHRADRQAERTGTAPRSAQEEEIRATVTAMMDDLPAHVVERTGRMYALALRAVLAFLDGERSTLAAVLARIQSWDREPGRPPHPDPPFRFPNEQAMARANALFYRAERHGAFISDKEAGEGGSDLVARHAPQEHRSAAQRVLRSMRADQAGGAVFNPAMSDGPAGLLAFAATAAWLAGDPRVYSSRETARLDLISEIKESEAKALRMPDRETIIEIRDEQALAFLEQLYAPGDSPLPKGAFERAVWEIDVLAVLKQHLLEHPADATSPEQATALRERLAALMGSAVKDAPTRPDRGTVVRHQPKRTSKRRRK
ncbi:hypothetical protein [Streptacidiphilus sp. MAP5-52]|uniref:hypothetical protein n=1 Tax=Streptacidiphilus sp. MAP5-52 TaxID=3156267 RepID=UPI003514E146